MCIKHEEVTGVQEIDLAEVRDRRLDMLKRAQDTALEEIDSSDLLQNNNEV